jgi:hypothetical protein
MASARAAIPPAAEVTDVHALVGSRDEPDFVARGMGTMKEQIIRLVQLYGCAGRAG